jgi:hypothetical protein
MSTADAAPRPFGLKDKLRRRSQKMIPYMDLNEQMNPNEQG